MTHTAVDAKNRIVAVIHPDGSTVRRSYNRGGYLQSIVGTLKGDAIELPFLVSAEYDEYGRPVIEVSGNGVVKERTFEKLTGRLATTIVRRKTGTTQTLLQSLTYTYDPEGNTVCIVNDAEHTVFFGNLVERPQSEYTYDAIYRLIEAKGRENVGQTVASPSGPEVSSLPPPPSSPADAVVMVQYAEQYEYDAANNLTVTRHQYNDSKVAGWTRNFTYETESGLARSNRLMSTSIGKTTSSYTYDNNGNITSMPELNILDWDYRNQLHRSSQQGAGVNTPETTWYCYDSQGGRVRKVTERQSKPGSTAVATQLKERLIVGGYDIYREYQSDGVELSQQCTTLTIRDAQQLDVLVEQWTTMTKGRSAGMQTRLVRYQYQDHVNSVFMELDDTGALVSVDEFTPYGSTTHRSLNVHGPKRFRFAGKEADGESGLSYFGRRYYAPWLARWISPDPIGIADGLNVFEYVVSNPLRYRDPHGTCHQSTLHRPLRSSHAAQTTGVPQQSAPGAITAGTSASAIRTGRSNSTSPSNPIRFSHFSGAGLSFPYGHPLSLALSGPPHPTMQQHFRQSISMQTTVGMMHSSVKSTVENLAADVGGGLAGEAMSTALGSSAGQMAGSAAVRRATSTVPFFAAMVGGYVGAFVAPKITNPIHEGVQGQMSAHSSSVSNNLDVAIGAASVVAAARSTMMEPNLRQAATSLPNLGRALVGTSSNVAKGAWGLYSLNQSASANEFYKSYRSKSNSKEASL
ncbi:hypothetical protein B0A55_04117 [Friedmanniomyces simplex]|uniref:Uncharacterized protein n=1 Tax=Friedmanniomyces simplex TaxID=329884 RepID=A0A4V5NHF1_9PEZI|nr:hypothetical protein B0A55_04117 [Friedmanniomyces simplex]